MLFVYLHSIISICMWLLSVHCSFGMKEILILKNLRVVRNFQYHTLNKNS